MDRSLLPKPENIVVNKQNDEWVVTHRVDTQTVIRLRLWHFNRREFSDAICEIREGSYSRFRKVGRLLFAPFQLDPEGNQRPDLSDWPIEWRSEFVKLARVWSVCMAEWDTRGHATTSLPTARE